MNTCVRFSATNKLVYIMFVVLLILCGIALGIFYGLRNTNTFCKFLLRKRLNDLKAFKLNFTALFIVPVDAWYIPEEDSSEVWLGVTTFFLFLVFLSYLIPISLSVTIELQKFGCSKFFAWDNDMRCPKTGNRPICNTSDLNDELGQIEYLLTDKTGTLTENNLQFATCSINGIQYDYSSNGQQLIPLLEPWHESADGNDRKQIEFFEALALCHTAQVISKSSIMDDDDGLPTKPLLQYQSSSADEEVLLDAASSLGVAFLGEEKNIMTLEVDGTRNEFIRHLTLEFESGKFNMFTPIVNS